MNTKMHRPILFLYHLVQWWILLLALEMYVIVLLLMWLALMFGKLLALYEVKGPFVNVLAFIAES